MKILIIEDDDLDRELFEAKVKKMGHEAQVVPDARLMARMKDDEMAKFDAIITDYMMPIMDGTEVLRHLRHISWKKPVLLHSSTMRALSGKKLAEIVTDFEFAKFALKSFDDSQIEGFLNEIATERGD